MITIEQESEGAYAVFEEGIKLGSYSLDDCLNRIDFIQREIETLTTEKDKFSEIKTMIRQI